MPWSFVFCVGTPWRFSLPNLAAVLVPGWHQSLPWALCPSAKNYPVHLSIPLPSMQPCHFSVLPKSFSYMLPLCSSYEAKSEVFSLTYSLSFLPSPSLPVPVAFTLDGLFFSLPLTSHVSKILFSSVLHTKILFSFLFFSSSYQIRVPSFHRRRL